MAVTYNYGKDRSGKTVYESSTKGGKVDKANAINASGGSSLPNIILSSTKYNAQGIPEGQTKTQNYVGSTPSGSPTFRSAITSSSITPSSAISIPSPSPTSTTGTNAMTGVIGTLGGALANVGAEQTKTEPPVTPVPTDIQTRINAMLDIKRPKTEDIYQKTLKETGVNEKQALVNTYTGQLNAIVAKSQADKLALTDQGRGIPEVIIGGQQARIDKEAAIQSLPIAAQLSAAQGDLAMAKDQMNTLFTIRSQDAKADYDFKVKMVDTVFNYADKQQQIALEDKRTKESQAFQMKMNNINYAQSLSSKAYDNGQSTIGSALMRLDPNDPNYSSNIASLAQNIQVAQKGGGGSGGGTLEERQAGVVGRISSKIVPGARTPETGIPILDPSGYINPAAWKEMIKVAPLEGLPRPNFVANFGSQLYIDPKTDKPAASYGLTPKEVKDLGYE